MRQKCKAIQLAALVAAVLTAAVVILLGSRMGLEDLTLDERNVEVWGDWQLQREDGSLERVTLPLRVSAQPEEVFRLARTLPQELVSGRSVCIRASSQEITAYVDGEETASYGGDASRQLMGNPGSAWFLFRLPENSGGKELVLEYTSPYQQFSGHFNEVLYGSKTSLLFAIAKKYWAGFVGSLFIFFGGGLGVIINAAVSVRRKKGPSPMLWLSLFAMLAGMWSMCESKLLQLFTGNQMLLCYGHYLLFMLLPLPFTLYMEVAYTKHHREFGRWFFAVFCLNFFACVALQAAGTAGFFELLPVAQVLLGIYMAAVIVSLTYESLRYRNQQAKLLLLTMIPLFLSAAAELINFAFRGYGNVTDYMVAGLIGYVVTLSALSLWNLNRSAQRGREAEYFKRMAYIDFLTGGKNRAAFQSDVEALTGKGLREPFWLVSLDMNGLKQVNDVYGHLEGDKAIKKAFEAVSCAFGAQGQCYRMGGDEFICIVRVKNEADIVKSLREINRMLKKEQTGLAYDITLASGYAQYTEQTDMDFAEFWNFVDKKMYQDKERRNAPQPQKDSGASQEQAL